MAGTFDERKALSPAIAAVILIGVVVAVSIAVSLWMSSLSVSLMRIDEVKIVSHNWASDLSYIDLIVKNAGTETGSITFFDDVTIRYSVAIEPSVALVMEENLFP